MAEKIGLELKCCNCLNSFQLSAERARRTGKKLASRLPLLLPCGHTFCSLCLPKLAYQASTSIQCPLCKAVVPYRSGEDVLMQIPPNLVMLGILYAQKNDFVQVLRNSQGGRLLYDDDNNWVDKNPVSLSPGPIQDELNQPCENCTEATHLKCKQCTVPLCTDCFKSTHSSAQFLRNHSLVSLLSRARSPCPVHGCPMDRFCRDDAAVVCPECCAQHHAQHSVVLVEEKSEQLRETLDPLLGQCKTVLQTMGRSYQCLSNEGMSTPRRQAQDVDKQLQKRFVQLHSVLQAQYFALLNQTATIAHKKAVDSLALTWQLKADSEKLKHIMACTKGVLGDSDQLVQCGDKMVAEIKASLELPCEIVEMNKSAIGCHFNGGIEDFIKTIGTITAPDKEWFVMGKAPAESYPAALGNMGSDDDEGVGEVEGGDNHSASTTTAAATVLGYPVSTGRVAGTLHPRSPSGSEEVEEVDMAEEEEEKEEVEKQTKGETVGDSDGDGDDVDDDSMKGEKQEDENELKRSEENSPGSAANLDVTLTESLLTVVHSTVLHSDRSSDPEDGDKVLDDEPLASDQGDSGTDDEEETKYLPSVKGFLTGDAPTSHLYSEGMDCLHRPPSGTSSSVRSEGATDLSFLTQSLSGTGSTSAQSSPIKQPPKKKANRDAAGYSPSLVHRSHNQPPQLSNFSDSSASSLPGEEGERREKKGSQSQRPYSSGPVAPGSKSPAMQRSPPGQRSPKVQRPRKVLKSPKSQRFRGLGTPSDQGSPTALRKSAGSRKSPAVSRAASTYISPDGDLSSASECKFPKTKSRFRIRPPNLDGELVSVTSVISPSQFYVQCKEDEDRFSYLSDQFSSSDFVCNAVDEGSVRIGLLYAASTTLPHSRQPALAEMFRVELLKLPTNLYKLYTVYFIDTGKTGSVKILFSLPDSLSTLPPSVHACKLANIAPAHHSNMPDGWTDQVNLHFNTSVQDMDFRLTVVGNSSKDGTLPVELHYLAGQQWIRLADDLIEKGLVAPFIAESQPYGDRDEGSRAHGRVVQAEGARQLHHQELPPGTTQFKCCVSTWKGPDDFHIQLVFNDSILQELMDRIQHAAVSASKVVNPRPGQICLAPFTSDEELLWYRVRILDYVENGSLPVLYLDFGNEDLIPVDSIRAITPPLLSLPAQGIPCRLAGVVPVDQTSWTAEACGLFCELITTIPFLEAELADSNELALHLNIIDPPVGDQLVKAKHARYSGAVAFPPPALPQSRDVFKGKVVHAQTPGTFHVKKYDYTTDEQLCRSLSGLSPSRRPAAVKWRRNDCCCAHYLEDAAWHRGVIIEEVAAHQYQVYYVDYGNSAVASSSDIVPVSSPELFAVPQQALRCQLHGVNPPPTADETWDHDSSDAFYQFVQDKMLTVEVKVVDIQQSPSVFVSLKGWREQAEAVDVGDMLVARGYAVYPESVSTLPLHTGRTFPCRPVPAESTFRMLPICIQSDGVVVGQEEGIKEELAALMAGVKEFCKARKDRPRSVSELRKGQPCCSLFSDGLWYRAVIDGVDADGVAVCYVDFGNCDVVSLNDIILEPVALDVPVMHTSLTLEGMECFTWNETFADVLAQMIIFDEDPELCTVSLTCQEKIGGSLFGTLIMNNGSDVVSVFLGLVGTGI